MSTAISAKTTGTRVGSSRWTRAIIGVLLFGAIVGIAYWASIPRGNLLAETLSVPLNGARTARIDVNADTAHLTIDRLTGGEQLLAGGTLQYFEKQGQPARTTSQLGDQATFAVRGGGKAEALLPLPWTVCGGTYEWRLHLNPAVKTDLTAFTGGGNVKLDLAGLAIAGLAVESSGGNVDVALPDGAANLTATAKTGGGNVTVDVGSGTTGRNTVRAESGGGDVVVRIPSGLAARVHATTGLGKAIVDPRLSQTDKDTYQSADFEVAADRVDITLKSGAGNVTVNVR